MLNTEIKTFLHCVTGIYTKIKTMFNQFVNEPPKVKFLPNRINVVLCQVFYINSYPIYVWNFSQVVYFGF